MAKSKSLLTAGLRGAVGGTLMFRKMNGETVVSAFPEKSSKEPSEKQLAQRGRFRLASLYAQRIKTDPVLLEEYVVAAAKKGYPSARSLMIADYFRLPEILSMNVNTQQDGTVLEALVVDYMRVQSVTVSMKNPEGQVLESGSCTLSADQQTWTYAVQVVEHLVAGVNIEFIATDLPGNVTTESFEYQA